MIALTLLLATLFAQAAEPDFDQATNAIRQTLAEMVKADTTNPPGNEERIVEIVAKRLKTAGIPFEVTEFDKGRKNIVARIKGSGEFAPVLLLAHTDVVGAGGQKWATHPHELVEKNGYLIGRGVFDDLGMAATELEVFLMMKNLPLRRDLILALTGDEESGGAGIQYLLKHKYDSVKAAIALNEGGGVVLGSNGKPNRIELQVGEKNYRDFELVAEGTTGHSSVPMPDNAIYRLARALDRLGTSKPPLRLIPAIRAYLEKRAEFEPPELKKAMLAAAGAKGPIPEGALKVIAKEPGAYAVLQTTCVATMVSGGTRVNALPAQAKANINCRILPDETPEQVQSRLAKIIDDPKIKITSLEDFGTGQTSPMKGEFVTALEKVSKEMWPPGLPIIPSISLGATDSRFLRNAGILCYGIQPIALTKEDGRRAHGIDERIPVASLKPGVSFFYRLVSELAVKR